MNKHVAPSITIEFLRYVNPNRYGIHTLTPTDEPWNLYPLGTAQPRYKHESVLVSEQSATETRHELAASGYRPLTWNEVPAYLREYMIDHEAPLEFKKGLREGNQEFTGEVAFWVKGTLPTARLDKVEVA